MRLERVENLHFPVPAGFTITRTQGTVVLEGTRPDTSRVRNYRARYTFEILSSKDADTGELVYYLPRTCKVNVRREMLFGRSNYNKAAQTWENLPPEWVKAGYGGTRQTWYTLTTILEGRA